MSDALRIVQLNLAYDGRTSSPEALLSAYHTLTGWAGAVSRAGALVCTVQRFSRDAQITHVTGEYSLVADGAPGIPHPWETFDRVTDAVVASRPDVVHINGLMFPAMVTALRTALPMATIVLQDHSGALPRHFPWPIKPLTASRWQRAFATVDACTFTALELADRWRPFGLPRDSVVLEMPEASTDLAPQPIDDARHVTGIDASPAILWVGRLDANKDPMCVLSGLERGLAQLADARCWMLYGDGDLERAVRRRIDGSTVLRERVVLVGAVSRERVVQFYSAADIFLSGSHHEGSGYALIESMACGLSPCVTDIAAFRALTGSCGARWQVGDAPACARALLDVAARDRDAERRFVRRHFDAHLSWDVIGRDTVREYGDLVRQRRKVQRR